MNTVFRPASSRGATMIDWLKSWHTFSFAEYVDPAWNNFGPLRVINEDIISPNSGFGMHPHKNMEILSVILSGSLAHKDSMGNEAILPTGSIQLMSAGSGVRHSEYNPSSKDSVHLLQIWIMPTQRGTSPWYKDFHSAFSNVKGEKILVGEGGVGKIGQDVTIAFIDTTSGDISINKKVESGRVHWIQGIEGECSIGKELISQGDGIGITSGSYKISGRGKVLFFDMLSGQ